MSTRPQIAMIHTLKSKLGMNDDNYRAMLSGFGVESSKDLSAADAKAFIDGLMKMFKGGGVSAPPSSVNNILNGKTRYAASNEVATFAQQAMIRRLWDTVSRVPEADRARALNNFLEKRFMISHITWLPRERVGKVIHTLKAMAAQKDSKQINLDVAVQ
jgi:hypothetical protein